MLFRVEINLVWINNSLPVLSRKMSIHYSYLLPKQARANYTFYREIHMFLLNKSSMVLQLLVTVSNFYGAPVFRNISINWIIAAVFQQ